MEGGKCQPWGCNTFTEDAVSNSMDHQAFFNIEHFEKLRNLAIYLEEVQKGHDDYAAKASGLLSKMERFDTFFSLNFGYLIFSVAEQLSINLQSKDITIQEATKGATLLSSYLKSLRTGRSLTISMTLLCMNLKTELKNQVCQEQERCHGDWMMDQVVMCTLVLKTGIGMHTLKYPS